MAAVKAEPKEPKAAPAAPLTRAERLRAKCDKMNANAKKNGITEPVAFVAGDHPEKLDLGVIPTGLFAVDFAIGGGWSRGGASELYGGKGSGKTSLALQTIGNNQTLDPDFTAAYIYIEGDDFPIETARLAKVDFNRLIILGAEKSGEDIFDKLKLLLVDEKGNPTNDLDFVVVDSIAGIATLAELESTQEEGFQKSRPGVQAAFTSKLFRLLMGGGCLGKTALLLLNQERLDLAAKQPGTKTRPGGQSMQFWPKLALHLFTFKTDRLFRKLGKEDVCYGHQVRGEVTKNNTGRAHPWSTFLYDALYGVGPNHTKMPVDVLIKTGIVTESPTGGWLSFPFAEGKDGEQKIQGRDKLGLWLAERPEVRDALLARISES